MFEKMLFMDEEKLAGMAEGSKKVERDPEMVKEQERITRKIEEERIDIKSMRDTQV